MNLGGRTAQRADIQVDEKESLEGVSRTPFAFHVWERHNPGPG